jgi:Xaa-Pro aminopeptidase
MIEASVYARRRDEFMRELGPRAVAVLHSPPEARRNGDQHYRFRQSSDIYYLTGFAEPEATLVLRPGAERERFVMFVRPRDREREVWNGRRAGVEGAVAAFGADAAYPSAELERRLPDLVASCDDLCYGLGYDGEFDGVIARLIAELRLRERRGQRPPRRVVDPRALLHEMRLRKSPEEVDILRRAAAITAEAHVAAMSAAAPGVTEYELEALIDFTFRRRGGSGPGYGTIVGSGENATILHYVDNRRALDDGDLVLIDAGCEYELYTADVTRTFPVSGRFSPAQRRCYELVLSTQEEAVRCARPGVTLDDLHQLCVERLTEGMVELGLLEGPAAARIEDESYKRFYMHRTSHWLGLDVHDVGAYTTADGAARPLEPGMVITIEPGLYVAADDERAPAELRGIGIRIEDDVLVTADGPDVLTAAVPKSVDEVERACQGSAEAARRAHI